VENQNRPAHCRTARINNLKIKFEENRKENTPLQEIKTLLERGRCPVSNLLRMPFACVGLDWARPKFLFHLIVLIKLLLRLRSQVRIGVRAVGNKTNEQIRKRKRSRKTFNLDHKPYELTTTYTTPARHI
jgi:hypothetical protein